MGCFRGRKSTGNLPSKALPRVPVVIFCLLLMVTTVAAPPVGCQRLLAEEVAALKDIASSIKRSAELVTRTWSWVKVQLLGFALLMVTAIITGVTTLYLADLGRKKWPHWRSLRPSSLEDVFRDVFTPLMQQLSDQVAALGERLAAALGPKEELEESFLQHLVAYEKKVADVLYRMATSTPCAERQSAVDAKEVEDLRSEVANLQAELAGTRKADTERREKKKRKFESLEGLKDAKLERIGFDMLDKIEGESVTHAEASGWAAPYSTDP